MKKETKEILSYIIVGGLTTGVNYLVYYLFIMFHCNWLIANTIAWLFAVIFAYYTNKNYVFKSHNHVKNEFISFLSMRLATLIIENISLFLLIEILSCHQMLSKITVSVITVVLNYILCKFKIFKEEGVCCG